MIEVLEGLVFNYRMNNIYKLSGTVHNVCSVESFCKGQHAISNIDCTSIYYCTEVQLRVNI